ncbi:MAG: hypothetical protein KatS3mg128_1081 [Silanimonas sp.]|nr:MAG: hypothetical protein KatS3mg128_1081 [Silanimonas sp.]
MRLPLRSLLLAAGCALALPALAADTYGAPMPEGRPLAAGALLAEAEAHAGQTLKVEGRITEVCQAKGCWVMLDAGNGAGIRVKTAHRFFLPKDARGTAVVHGEFKAVELSEAQAAHFAEDGNTAAKPGREWQIVATSIVVSP